MSISSPPTGRHHTRRAALAVALLTVLLTATACNPTIGWKLGETHGAIIEPGARRASFGIYRKPRSVLYDVYEAAGTKAAQDALWSNAHIPVFSVSLDGIGISTALFNRKFHDYVYGDAADFRGALIDAERAHDCLALTLISQGLYIKNWTHKGVQCKLGSLP